MDSLIHKKAVVYSEKYSLLVYMDILHVLDYGRIAFNLSHSMLERNRLINMSILFSVNATLLEA
jgi:hypothetical protein